MHPLSLTNKRWIVKHKAPVKADQLVDFLFTQRKVQPVQTMGKMQDSSVFPDMEKAVDRINLAIEESQNIAIFGDYDCDGITASAQLIRFFRRRNIDPFCRLPHRLHDGYGISKKVVDELIEKKINLLITVDTGIASAKEIAYAKENNIDVIITDHHHAPESIPDCSAILHPALAPEFQGAHPSGSGVALALVRALEQDEWEDMETDICLAMFGTIADLVEIKGDNRILVYFGLKALSQINKGPLAFLKTLCDMENRGCTCEDIGFRIAPRINAAGRLDDPMLALHGLLGDQDSLHKLDAINKKRQDQTKLLCGQAVEQLNLTTDPTSADGQYLLCTASPDYHPGIIGLIAGRLTESYGKPSMAVYVNDELCTASLRSPPVYNITEGLSKIESLLDAYGGHAQAAGCSFKLANIDEIIKKLSEDISQKTTADDLVPTIEIDAELNAYEISLELIKNLNQLKPFGIGNLTPCFLLKNVLLQNVRLAGKDFSHLQCTVGNLKGIGFGLGKFVNLFSKPVNIVCQLEVDNWNSHERGQVVIRDVSQ